MQVNTILQGDALAMLRTLPDESVQCVVTSPPYYFLRDYGVDGQIGLEASPREFVEKLVVVFREARRVLKNDGVLWLNIGDTYARGAAGRKDSGTAGKFGGPDQGHLNREAPEGFKSKDLLLIPARLAIALQDDGWYVRSDCIWYKPTAMPEPVKDRPTRAHEYLYLLTKSERYYYDADAIREPLKPKTYTTFGIRHREQGNDRLGLVKSDNWGRSVETRQPRLNTAGEIAGANKKTVWTVASESYPGAHFATMPTKLVEPCILAGSRPGDVVLDPFMGSGTVAQVAVQAGRQYLGIELNPAYIELARKRLSTVQVNLWQAMTPAVSTIANLLPSSEVQKNEQEAV